MQKDFEGCTLTELRYDEDVENRFAEEIEKYHKENNQEQIVVLSTFDTDEKGGDGGFNPNDTYTNWQWHLVKTADKKKLGNNRLGLLIIFQIDEDVKRKVIRLRSDRQIQFR